MFLEEVLTDIMVKVAPNIYRKYVIMRSKGEPLLYVQIQKSVAWPTAHSTNVL